jgi:hypothetical protein
MGKGTNQSKLKKFIVSNNTIIKDPDIFKISRNSEL